MPAETLPITIGRYEIVAELGRGSMGRVFHARDPNVDRDVALKVLAPLHLVGAAGEEHELRERFLLEARAAGRLSHPGIVMVLDADADPATGAPYIVMELVAGRSLEDLLRERGRLSPERAVEIVGQVARSLAYAHAAGVIHRDVKPANILIPERGPVKVSDFGIAKLASQSMTVTGHVLGSPFFMSPEQVRGEQVDRRTDLFSLGAVLYQAVTGALPFAGDSIATVAFKVVNIEPRPARDHAPEIPEALEAVIDRALVKDPEERFRDGAEMAAALDAVAGAKRVDAGAGVGAEAGAAVAAVPPSTAADAARPSEPPAEERAGGVTVALPAAPTDTAIAEPESPAPGDAAIGPAPPRPSPAPPAARGARPAPARRGAWWVVAAAVAVAAVVAASLVALVVVAAIRPGSAPAESALETLGAGDPSAGPAAEVDGGAPPSEAAAPVEVPPSPPPAQLHLVYNSRLATGTMTVWVDEERAWTGPVSGPRNLLRRVAGREVRQTLPIPPGERTVEVRVSGRTAKIRVDAADRIRSRFEPAEQRWLRVAVNPLTNNLSLVWMD